LIEKTILLENISLVDFLGSENINIKTIAKAFPQTKIISRGDEISLKGNSAEIVRINEIINSLIEHYNKYGKVTEEDVQAYLRKDTIDTTFRSEKNNVPEDVIIYGAKGVPIKARTTNQKRLVEAVFKHDLVFAIGPAGTGKTYIAVAMAVRALKNKQVKKNYYYKTCRRSWRKFRFFTRGFERKNRPIYPSNL